MATPGQALIYMCQILVILDARVVDLLCLTAKTVRHFHPKRQPDLTHCAPYRASAMRTLRPLVEGLKNLVVPDNQRGPRIELQGGVSCTHLKRVLLRHGVQLASIRGAL